jgi:hypothetical protein
MPIPPWSTRPFSRSIGDCLPQRQWPQWASAAEVTRQDDRPHELVAHDDYHGHAIWHRITEAVSQLGNVMSTGALH